MSDGSMMGSGVYSVDVTLEIECECADEKCQTDSTYGCGKYFEADFSTDDWGNIDQDVECPQCKHKFNFQKEGATEYQEDSDRAHDEMGEW